MATHNDESGPAEQGAAAASGPSGSSTSGTPRRGSFSGPLLLGAAALAWAVFRGADGEGEGLPPRIPSLFLAGAGATAVVLLLGRTLPDGGAAGRPGAAPNAASSTARMQGLAVEVLAVACAALGFLALSTEDLWTYLGAAAGVLMLQGAAVGAAARGALRWVTPLVSVSGAGLLLASYFARPAVVRDGELAVLGTPLLGDDAPTLALAGLALGLVVPGAWGGAAAALAALGRASASSVSVALLACLPSAVLLRGVGRLMAGAEVLYAVGAAGALLAAVAAAGTSTRRAPAHGTRAAALVGGSFALTAGALGAASEGALDAAWVGLIAVGILGGAVALATVGLERLLVGAPPGFAPRGLARLHPTTSLLLALATLGLAGAPTLLVFAARARALGEVSLEGAGREAYLLAALQGPLLAAAGLALLHGLLFEPPPYSNGRSAVDPAARATVPGVRDGLLRTAILGLAGGLCLAFGLIPDAPFGTSPYGSDPRGATFPSAAGQIELLLGAGFVGWLWLRARQRFLPESGATER